MMKTVIFDLGKVLIPFDFGRGFAALQPHCPHPVEEIRRRLASSDLVHSLELGRVTPEDFVRGLSTQLDLNVSYDLFCELWSKIFLPETLVPDELLAALHSRFRLLLLSNTNAIHYAVIEANYPIIRHFDDRILSHEVGSAKPSPEIYREAIARALCRPEEIFFVDDIAENVAAAIREGMDAVQFVSAQQLTDELRARGASL